MNIARYCPWGCFSGLVGFIHNHETEIIVQLPHYVFNSTIIVHWFSLFCSIYDVFVHLIFNASYLHKNLSVCVYFQNRHPSLGSVVMFAWSQIMFK